MMRVSALLLLAASIALAAGRPVAAQEPAAPEPAQKTEAAKPADAAPPALPRSARWKPMEVRYLQADVRHPALYYDSVQEKLAHNDRRANNLLGAVAAGFYEIIQFPVQLGLTPLLLVIKPPWTMEPGRP